MTKSIENYFHGMSANAVFSGAAVAFVIMVVWS